MAHALCGTWLIFLFLCVTPLTTSSRKQHVTLRNHANDDTCTTTPLLQLGKEEGTFPGHRRRGWAFAGQMENDTSSWQRDIFTFGWRQKAW